LLRRSHGALDVQALDVLPVLLEEGNKEVDGHVDVLDKLVLGQGNVSDGNTQAKNLLHLQLDGLLLNIHEILQVTVGGQQDGELLGSVQSRTKKTGNVTNQAVGGEEDIVVVGHLLDDLLVLVHGLQVIDGLVGNTEGDGLVAVRLVTENAELEVLLALVTQDDAGLETLVAVRVIVLQTDLEFDGFDKLPLLFFSGVLQNSANGVSQGFGL
jgi:hypothetical protein